MFLYKSKRQTKQVQKKGANMPIYFGPQKQYCFEHAHLFQKGKNIDPTSSTKENIANCNIFYNSNPTTNNCTYSMQPEPGNVDAGQLYLAGGGASTNLTINPTNNTYDYNMGNAQYNKGNSQIERLANGNTYYVTTNNQGVTNNMLLNPTKNYSMSYGGAVPGTVNLGPNGIDISCSDSRNIAFSWTNEQFNFQGLWQNMTGSETNNQWTYNVLKNKNS